MMKTLIFLKNSLGIDYVCCLPYQWVPHFLGLVALALVFFHFVQIIKSNLAHQTIDYLINCLTYLIEK